MIEEEEGAEPTEMVESMNSSNDNILSYNAQTKEYFEKHTTTDTTVTPQAADPIVAKSADFTKVVKDGDFYYNYEYASPKGSEIPVYSTDSYKVPVSLYVLQDSKATELADGIDFLTPAWIEATDIDEITTAFNEVFASDANRKMEANADVAEDGTLTLDVSTKGSLSKTIEESTYVYTISQRFNLTSKEGKLTAADMELELVLNLGATQEVSVKQSMCYTFTYDFDQATYDSIVLTDVVDKADVQEQEYYLDYRQYTVFVDDDFINRDNTYTIDYTQTIAEQIASFKAEIESEYNDNFYGDVLGYYTDEAMTQPLPETMTEAEWYAIEHIYVKREARSSVVYYTSKITYDVKDSWTWFFSLISTYEDYSNGTTYVGYGDPCNYYFPTDYAQGGYTVKYYVDGVETAESEVDLDNTKKHVVETKIIITDPTDLIIDLLP